MQRDSLTSLEEEQKGDSTSQAFSNNPDQQAKMRPPPGVALEKKVRANHKNAAGSAQTT